MGRQRRNRKRKKLSQRSPTSDAQSSSQAADLSHLSPLFQQLNGKRIENRILACTAICNMLSEDREGAVDPAERWFLKRPTADNAAAGTAPSGSSPTSDVDNAAAAAAAAAGTEPSDGAVDTDSTRDADAAIGSVPSRESESDSMICESTSVSIQPVAEAAPDIATGSEQRKPPTSSDSGIATDSREHAVKGDGSCSSGTKENMCTPEIQASSNHEVVQRSDVNGHLEVVGTQLAETSSMNSFEKSESPTMSESPASESPSSESLDPMSVDSGGAREGAARTPQGESTQSKSKFSASHRRRQAAALRVIPHLSTISALVSHKDANLACHAVNTLRSLADVDNSTVFSAFVEQKVWSVALAKIEQTVTALSSSSSMDEQSAGFVNATLKHLLGLAALLFSSPHASTEQVADMANTLFEETNASYKFLVECLFLDDHELEAAELLKILAEGSPSAADGEDVALRLRSDSRACARLRSLASGSTSRLVRAMCLDTLVSISDDNELGVRLVAEYVLAPEEAKDADVGAFVFHEALSKLASETSKRQSVWQGMIKRCKKSEEEAKTDVSTEGNVVSELTCAGDVWRKPLTQFSDELTAATVAFELAARLLSPEDASHSDDNGMDDDETDGPTPSSVSNQFFTLWQSSQSLRNAVLVSFASLTKPDSAVIQHLQSLVEGLPPQYYATEVVAKIRRLREALMMLLIHVVQSAREEARIDIVSSVWPNLIDFLTQCMRPRVPTEAVVTSSEAFHGAGKDLKLGSALAQFCALALSNAAIIVDEVSRPSVEDVDALCVLLGSSDPKITASADSRRNCCATLGALGHFPALFASNEAIFKGIMSGARHSILRLSAAAAEVRSESSAGDGFSIEAEFGVLVEALNAIIDIYAEDDTRHVESKKSAGVAPKMRKLAEDTREQAHHWLQSQVELPMSSLEKRECFDAVIEAVDNAMRFSAYLGSL